MSRFRGESLDYANVSCRNNAGGRRLQHTATHCNTLQHAAEHCNTCCNNAGGRRFGRWRGFRGESLGYCVATSSRLLKIIGLLCRISSLLQGSFAKETYNFKEPTNRSPPIFECVLSRTAGRRRFGTGWRRLVGCL